MLTCYRRMTASGLRIISYRLERTCKEVVEVDMKSTRISKTHWSTINGED